MILTKNKKINQENFIPVLRKSAAARPGNKHIFFWPKDIHEKNSTVNATFITVNGPKTYFFT